VNACQTGSMKINEMPTSKLMRLLRVSETSRQPDQYALCALRRELERRLDLACSHGEREGEK